MRRTFKTIDDSIELYENCDLRSRVVARVPKGSDIQLGAVEVVEGREWMEASLEDGSTGYVLGPTARGHTTFTEEARGTMARGEAARTDGAADEKGWLLFPDKQSALDARARWEKLLPRQKSSYRPSGKLSQAGWIVLLTAGMAAGVTATVLGGFVVAFVYGYATSFFLHLVAWLWGRKIGDVLDAIFSFAPLLALALVSLLPGFFGALTVRTISHAVKNQKANAAAFVGLASGGVGAFLFCRWGLGLVASHLLTTLPDLPADTHSYSVYFWSSVLTSLQHGGAAMWVTLWVCVVASAVVGAAGAGGAVEGDKFCEPCGKYMGSRQMSFASLEEASAFVDAMKRGISLSTAAFDLATVAYGGPRITVFQCAKCNTGYLEVDFTFRAKWQIPNEKGKENYGKTRKTWLAASALVTTDQIAKLRM